MKLYKLTETQEHQFQIIKSWAIEKHRQSGCLYSGYDYDLHINSVVNVGRKYLHLIDEEARFDTLAAAACHDLIEDCRVNWNELAAKTSPRPADIVYAVTDELGRNRTERAEKTHPKIAALKEATFVKLDDRISNMKFSYFVNDDKGMFIKYKNEFPKFFKALYNDNHGFDAMWEELKALTLA